MVLCAAAASVDKQSGWVAFAVLVVTLMPLDMKGLSLCRFKVGLDALLDCWPDPKPWASVIFFCAIHWNESMLEERRAH